MGTAAGKRAFTAELSKGLGISSLANRAGPASVRSVVEKGNELTRLIEEGSSRRNDRQRVGVCDHGGAQDSFDASKLSAEGGWRDVERFRGSRDAGVPGYVQEVA
ncbi:hypothetical protein GCM10022384_28930 [Streptomyces marokkonensis]|uniref:Uncharacterized protein n=1 Tax=Streptomyces marokkonensis TaxID=324855 RepID=A0ABP7Q6G7_9ACTN